MEKGETDEVGKQESGGERRSRETVETEDVGKQGDSGDRISRETGRRWRRNK